MLLAMETISYKTTFKIRERENGEATEIKEVTQRLVRARSKCRASYIDMVTSRAGKKREYITT